MVEIENANFSYTPESGAMDLRNINLSVASGECVLLCGASGCGKTTLTKLVNGLIPHFDDGDLRGHAYVDDTLVPDMPLYLLSQKVGSVFQNPKSQFFNIDFDSELAFGLENNGIEPTLMKARLRRVVSDLHIEHLLHRNVFSMSGGEKQALAFASVYAMNPDVYVLDEPSANLDQAATEILRTQIRAIRNQGKTVLIAEHRLHYLADLIDRAILMENGCIRQEYSRQQFLDLTDDQLHHLGLRSTRPDPGTGTATPADHSGALEIRDLSVTLKKRTIFGHLDFAASPGKILGITGHNGAGKTTLLRCIAGLQKESAGEIRYLGRALNTKQRNRLCYMIMQDVNHQLFGDSVWEECALSAASNPDGAFIEQILRDFDLLDMKEVHPMALSGGQKQRLAIVTGLLADKKILMFDEPSSGLDYRHMRTVSRTLRTLSETGHIVIVVTHDMELLRSTCDQILTF